MDKKTGDKKEKEGGNEEQKRSTHQGHEAKSDDRKLYDAIYPQPRKVLRTSAVFVSMEELMRALPHRVVLSRINDIFAAWATEEAKSKLNFSFPKHKVMD